MTAQYVVVGGGIAGASVAFHLANAGESVTVYEQGKLAGETTGKSGGIFAFYGTPVQYRMKQYGMELYNDFLRNGAMSQRYDRLGHLEVATTEEGAQRVGEKIAAETDSQPLFERLDGDDIERRVLFPNLNTEAVEAAVHVPNVGAFDGPALTREFAMQAEKAGATITIGTGVTSLRSEDGTVTGIECEDEFVPADGVVLAAGPWNTRLASTAGLDLPVGHSLAPILVLDPDIESDYTVPYLNHAESGVYCIGRDDGTVLVGCHTDGDAETQLDPSDQSEAVPEDLHEQMRSVVADLFPAFADAPVVDEWVGIRSVTPDGNPIIGRTEREGLSVVAFDSSGIQLAPSAGRVVARQLVSDDPTDHYEMISLSRFDGHDDYYSPET
ncbi:MAG: FAD-dependent oxidoreductase [Haloarculaceae archaeon]